MLSKIQQKFLLSFLKVTYIVAGELQKNLKWDFRSLSKWSSTQEDSSYFWVRQKGVKLMPQVYKNILICPCLFLLCRREFAAFFKKKTKSDLYKLPTFLLQTEDSQLEFKGR